MVDISEEDDASNPIVFCVFYFGGRIVSLDRS
jgi:hypothetical protein